jgi:hypothetical protein
VEHTDWNDLSQAVRDLIEVHTGPVRAARTVTGGLNSQLAAVLDTADGPLFVKGLRTDHPGVVRQQREAMINPYVLPLAPRLRRNAPPGERRRTRRSTSSLSRARACTTRSPAMNLNPGRSVSLR